MQLLADDLRDAEIALLEGHTLNCVGVAGSGRSRFLALLAEHLRTGGWHVLQWGLDELRSLTRKEKRGLLEASRSDPANFVVLIIDDFGRHLVDDDGPWLDQFLFAELNEQPTGAGEYLRCVVATAPRDSEIVGNTSSLRERAKTIFPSRSVLTNANELGFGFKVPEELLRFSGGNHLLRPKVSKGDNEDRGIALRSARALLGGLVADLHGQQQRRLQTLLDDPNTHHWRSGGIDEYLVPLAVPLGSETGENAHVPEAVRRGDIGVLLISERWPERDLSASARRFAARCGNEPSPIWVDNFLSDRRMLDLALLAEFLQNVLMCAPTIGSLRLLSRQTVDGERVDPNDLASAITKSISAETRAKLEWRLYNSGGGADLHDRQLILPRRGTAFAIPIVRTLMGQKTVGNASDSELLVAENGAVLRAWRSGMPLPIR
jgi:hypothetical protein